MPPKMVAAVDHRFVNLDPERRILAEVGAEVIDLKEASEDEVIDRVSSVDGIMLGARFQFDRKRLRLLERCRVIARYGVGYDNVDLGAAVERGIAVTFVPDYCVEEVANHAIALLLGLHRHLFEFNAGVRAGILGIPPGVLVPRLSGCTLGILGFGRIGSEVARRGLSLGLRVTAFDPYVAEASIRIEGVVPVSLDEAIERADFLSLHFPLNSTTRHVLNASSLARMKPGAIVINVARGGLIDEDALAAAIRSGHLGGAGLDVTEIEPLQPAHALWKLPRVILTPHVAWLSKGASQELQVKTAEEIARVLRHEPPLHLALPLV